MILGISWRDIGKAESKGPGPGGFRKGNAVFEEGSALENGRKGNADTIIQMAGSQLSLNLEEMKQQRNLQPACLC